MMNHKSETPLIPDDYMSFYQSGLEENGVSSYDYEPLLPTSFLSESSIRAFIAGVGAEGREGYVRSQRERLIGAIDGLEPGQIEYLISVVSLLLIGVDANDEFKPYVLQDFVDAELEFTPTGN